MVGQEPLRVSAHPAEQPTTPKKLPWLHNAEKVNEALRRFGTESGIIFPLPGDKESPEKRNKSPTHEIKRLFSQLFFMDRDILERPVRTFLDWLPVFKDQEEKLDDLLRRLTETTKDYLSSKPTPSTRRHTDALGEESMSTSLPPSPTMSAKHAPKVTVDEIGEIHLPPLTTVTSNNTSFATTLVHISFTSDEQNGAQTPVSPATTLSFSSTKEFGSSLSETAWNNLQSQVTAPEHALASHAESDDLVRANNASDSSTQDTYYGSSSWIPELDIEKLAEPPDGSPANKDEHRRIKMIPSDGLTSLRLPISFCNLPFLLRWECMRLIQTGKVNLNDLEYQWCSPRNFASFYKIASEICPGFCGSFTGDDETYSLCARLRWTKSKDGPLLKLELLPLQKQHPTGFQQRFGNDRFLFLEVEALSKPPEILDLNKKQTSYILKRFLEMLSEPQQLLGRSWLQFHAQQKKRKKNDIDFEKAGVTQYILVALSATGEPLKPLDLRTVVGWALPFKENADQSWCKAYARLDLRASRALMSIMLSPDDIEFVDDIHATEDPPDTQFNDPGWDFHSIYDPKVVMNDGCSEAHDWIFRRIRQVQRAATIPSVAQIRCALAKGMISRQRPDKDGGGFVDHINSRPPGPLIQINKSQSKLKLRQEDLHVNEYDQQTLALNIVQISHPLKPSYLYFDFLPIMIERHVPAQVIENFARVQAKRDVGEFLDALNDSDALRKWIYRQNSRRHGEITSFAGFPKVRTEKAIQMLESGFEATKFDPLAELMRRIAKDYFKQQRRRYKIQLNNSTMAFVIADPTGLLGVDEIQLNISTPFQDPSSGETWPSHLSGAVLVARNPCARPSDMQKVNAVYRSELSHLTDVLIFSTKGPRPIADKLSGGDYDGDQVFVCWDESLVKDFKNAPAPEPADPRVFNIQVDERRLSEIVPDPLSEEQVRRFVQMGTANRLEPNLLGVVTKTLEKVVYNDGIQSIKATRLADLKDLLMDSDKNGRTFTNEAWDAVKKSLQISGLREPAYARTTAADDDSLAENKPITPADCKNILDNVHCFILEPILEEAREQMHNKLANAVTLDEDLTCHYDETLASATNPVICSELRELKQKLANLKTTWCQLTSGVANLKPSSEKSLLWNGAIARCRKLYVEIQPEDMSHDTVVEWLRSRGNDLTMWESLKASALAKFHHSMKMCFHLAGNELCLLKVRAGGSSRTLRLDYYTDSKPSGKRKRASEDVFEDETDEADEDMDIDG